MRQSLLLILILTLGAFSEGKPQGSQAPFQELSFHVALDPAAACRCHMLLVSAKALLASPCKNPLIRLASFREVVFGHELDVDEKFDSRHFHAMFQETLGSKLDWKWAGT